MQIQAGGYGSFHKRFAQAVLAEDNQRDGPLDARAAPRFFSHGITGSIHQGRLAHVCSKVIRLLVPATHEDAFLQRQSFRANANSLQREASPSTIVHGMPLAEPHAANVSRTMPRCRYFHEDEREPIPFGVPWFSTRPCAEHMPFPSGAAGQLRMGPPPMPFAALPPAMCITLK